MAIEFNVRPEIMQRIKEARLSFFEQQIGETQLNILILQKSVETYNEPNDIASLAQEQIKLNKLVLNFETVEGVVTE